MTDKAKLEEIKKLADAMYYAALNLTTDASLLRKAMNEYHQFVIHKYCKEEPVSEDLGKYINELSKQFPEVSFAKLSRIAVRVAKWQREQVEKEYSNLNKGLVSAKGLAVYMAYEKGKEDMKQQMMKDAKESDAVITSGGILLSDLRIEDFNYEDKVKVIIVKED